VAADADQGPLLVFADLLDSSPEVGLFTQERAAESTGRPLGDDRFIARLERLTGRL
jgi:putative transposase